MDRAIGQCVASAAIATIGGGFIGVLTGGDGKSAAKGAAIGAAIGVGACAVLIRVAAEEDRKRIREAEIAAIRANSTQKVKFTTEEGETAVVSTTVTKAPIPSPKATSSTPPSRFSEKLAGMIGERKIESSDIEVTEKSSVTSSPDSKEPQFTTCRYSEQSIEIGGQSTAGERQMWCRLPSGDWQIYK